jgi:hypothetical protein
MEFEVQRLQVGDVILVDLPEHGAEIEAKVVREIDRIDRIDRAESTVRVTLRVGGETTSSGSGRLARYRRTWSLVAQGGRGERQAGRAPTRGD